MRADMLRQLPQQPFKAIIKDINPVAGQVQLQIAGSASWQWFRCLENIGLDEASVGQEAVLAFFGGEPIVVGLLQVGGKQYNVPPHSHADDAEGSQLDWDDVWADAVHSHKTNAEGGILVAGVAVYNNANISIPNAAWTALTFNSERWDADGYHSTLANTSRLTVPTGYAGWHVMSGNIHWDGAPPTGYVAIMLNNGAFIAVTELTNTTMIICSIPAIYYLSDADFVELYVYQNSGAPKNILVSGNYSPEFRAVRVT